MKKLLFALVFPLMACEESKRCSFEFPNICHTEAEWNKISENNLKAIECFNKNIKRFKNNWEKTNKFCGQTEIIRIEFL